MALCHGDDEVGWGFDDVFRGEYHDLVRTVAPIVGSVPDAEAVVQEAFLKAFVRWGRISRYDRPGAWVRRVAIRDAVRFAERHRRAMPDPDGELDAVDGVASYVDLQAALGRLSPKQRACVVLHHLADWPVEDVSDAVGCSASTVRVRLHRGRTALAALLTAEPEELTDGR